MEKQERIDVSLLAEKEGWFLQKYRVESEVKLGKRSSLKVRNATRACCDVTPTSYGFQTLCLNATYVLNT